MQVDTGSAVSVIGEREFKSMHLDVPINSTDVTLTTYTKEAVKPTGVCRVNVQHRGSSYGPLDLYVVKNSSASPLMGREWINIIELNWAKLSPAYQVDV